MALKILYPVKNPNIDIDITKGHTPELNYITLSECEMICDNVLSGYNHPTLKDYPAATVTCALSPYSPRVQTRSSSDSSCAWHNHILMKRLAKLKSISDTGLTTRNPVGHCAEPRAASALLSGLNPDRSIDDLCFSGTFRARTKCYIEYCENCKASFKNL